MNYWLLKSEPSEFSITDLERVAESVWDGVRNYQVRNSFRDVMQVGDKALFYHSSCADIGVVGEMEIVIPAVPDPTQFNLESKYFDPKSTRENPRWLGPKVRFVSRFKKVIPLADIRADNRFSNMTLLKPGNRLSAFLITKAEYEAIVNIGLKNK